MLIFTSLVFAILFGMLTVLTLNYAIYSWESKRLSDLTSQIKPGEPGLSAGGSFSKNFSSVDLGASLNKNRAIQVAGSIYDRAVITITKQEYPSWINKIVEEINLFRKNAWKSLSRLLKYLITLTKPVIKQEVEPKATTYSENDTMSPQSSSSGITDSEDQKEQIEIQDVDYKTQQERQKEDNLATISFAANTSQKSAAEMTIFEKVESRILDKLKSSGFEHYDIWLELGSLYEKYDEKDKAQEVYAFVLKQSDGREKDIARDKLIGLS